MGTANHRARRRSDEHPTRSGTRRHGRVSLTLIPLRYLDSLGVESVGTITLTTGGGPITARLARVDLELHILANNPCLVCSRRLRRAARPSPLGADELPGTLPGDLQHTTPPLDLAPPMGVSHQCSITIDSLARCSLWSSTGKRGQPGKRGRAPRPLAPCPRSPGPSGAVQIPLSGPLRKPHGKHREVTSYNRLGISRICSQ